MTDSDEVHDFDVTVSIEGPSALTLPSGGRDEDEAIDEALDNLRNNRELIDLLDVTVQNVEQRTR